MAGFERGRGTRRRGRRLCRQVCEERWFQGMLTVTILHPHPPAYLSDIPPPSFRISITPTLRKYINYP
eukprot:751438-Hanusia_phi.AAC.2